MDEHNGAHARGLPGTQGATSILTQPGVPSTLLVSGSDNRPSPALGQEAVQARAGLGCWARDGVGAEGVNIN